MYPYTRTHAHTHARTHAHTRTRIPIRKINKKNKLIEKDEEYVTAVKALSEKVDYYIKLNNSINVS
jgi:hypothetical protein